MSANLDPKIVARVRQGIALLDARAPLGWRRKINPDQLDIALPGYCALAHIYGHYEDGLDALNLTPTKAIEYGFNIGCADHEPCSNDACFDAVTVVWMSELGFVKLPEVA